MPLTIGAGHFSGADKSESHHSSDINILRAPSQDSTWQRQNVFAGNGGREFEGEVARYGRQEFCGAVVGLYYVGRDICYLPYFHVREVHFGELRVRYVRGSAEHPDWLFVLFSHFCEQIGTLALGVGSVEFTLAGYEHVARFYMPVEVGVFCEDFKSADAPWRRGNL